MSGEQKRQGKTDEMRRFAKGKEGGKGKGETEWISGRAERWARGRDAMERGGRWCLKKLAIWSLPLVARKGRLAPAIREAEWISRRSWAVGKGEGRDGGQGEEDRRSLEPIWSLPLVALKGRSVIVVKVIVVQEASVVYWHTFTALLMRRPRCPSCLPFRAGGGRDQIGSSDR